MTDTTTAPATPAPATATTLAPAPTVESARARRAEIINNPELSAKYMKGDAALRKEMHELNERIANQDTAGLVQSALNGVEPGEFSNMTTQGILARHEYASAAEHLVPALGRTNFEAIASGRATVTEAAHAEAVQLKKLVMSDREWTRAYYSGSELHRQQMLRINAVLGCSIAEPGKETMKVFSPLSST
jgi:hypothetical protein